MRGAVLIALAAAVALAACQPPSTTEFRSDSRTTQVQAETGTAVTPAPTEAPEIYHAEGFETRVVYYNPNCTVIEIKRPDGRVMYMGQGYKMACTLVGETALP